MINQESAKKINGSFTGENSVPSRPSKGMLEKLLNSISEIAALINKSGEFLYINDASLSLWGFRPEELTGKQCFDLILEEDKEASIAAFEKMCDEGKGFHFTNRFLAKDKSVVEMSWFGYWDEMQQILFVQGRDITSKNKNDELIRRLSLVAKETNNAILITDLDRKIIYTNDAFTRITGYSFDDVKGKMAKEVLRGPQSNPLSDKKIDDYVQNNSTFNMEVLNYKKNGETYWAEFSAQPMFDNDGKQIGFFSIETDITERKQLEKKLEQEKKERQRQVTAAIIKTQENERVAIGRELHDNVNQVLTTVKLYNEMCLTEEQTNKRLLLKSVQQINFCIETIRGLSKALSSPRIEEIGLKDSIKELADAIAAAKRMRVNYFTYGVQDERISQDLQTTVYRIAQEQLTNVLKYSDASAVDVLLVGTSVSLALRIQDNGKGFDLKQARKGTGITNMITRAETLGGTLELVSKPGEGCSLMTEFPLAEADS
jgi:PAS domain S-box-containing protein